MKVPRPRKCHEFIGPTASVAGENGSVLAVVRILCHSASSRKGWQEARMPQLNFWPKQNLKEARRVLFLC